ncbi:MFS transporter [Staphylococcus epidermidis]|uniref:MFS transporter n=1 Tax=Staphylococcus epidermidis TaxID=1282 RepID=UPI00073B1692|nr:MFS transporter [Staphylococcus epidermidis]KTF21725.1 MFS transporter [Staphylococcus epidermidis]KTF25595.1 MFS transporter [Staphylococcus epidermidis]MBM5970622.1 MFS transporter [Staphylococcus epidermidis]MCO6347793.1 MFS transporter [Staphylococcus epidermidis]
MINLLKNKNFRLFFLAEIISAFGVGISTVGANWYLIDKTNNSQLLGIMLALNVLSGFLASPIIGGFSDKYNRRNIILITYTIQIILYILIAISLLVIGFKTYLIIGFAVVNGIGWTTYMATSRSLVKQILLPQQYTEANSLLEVSLQTGMFVAGGLSGILYKIDGFTLIIIITILMFLISVIILLNLRIDKPILSENEDQKGLLKEYLLGWKFLKDNIVIFIFGIISIIPMIFTMIFNISLPGYVYNVLKLTSVQFGFSDMLYGIGGLCAGLISAVITKKITTKLMIFVLYIILVINSAVFIWWDSIFYLFVGSFLLGYSISSVRVYMNTAIMNTVPDRYVGRSFTIWTSVSLLLQSVISPFLGKWINEINDKFGFYIILITSLIIFIILILLNRTNQITYYYKEE